MFDLNILGNDSSFSNLSKNEKDILLKVLALEIERREESAKPVQIKEITPIEQWLESDYYLGPNGVYIYDYWKEMITDIFGKHRNNSNRVNEVIMSGCFTGDTKISMLDGRELSMLELVEEYGMRKEFWVYACDKDSNVVAGRAFNVRKTKVNQTIIEITLDNGKTIKSTLGHKFLLRDNTYKRADELVVGQSLMPLIREQKGDYEYCYSPIDGEYYQIDLCYKSDIQNKGSILRFLSDMDLRAITLKSYEEGWDRLEIEEFLTKLDSWWESNDSLTYRNSNRTILGIHVEHILDRQKYINEKNFKQLVNGTVQAYTIQSIKILEEKEDVYDFEVEEHHNFALASGVFVSNSIGIGKSTCANIIMLRKMYELSCYKNVTSLFNLMRTSNIVFLYFSVNKSQAQLTGFGDMLSLIDSIPYFKEEFPRNEKINNLILLPENMMMTFGSGTQHAIGMNMLGSILDEANFFGGEGKESSVGGDNTGSRVAELYSSIVNRSKSRFVSDGGVDNSLNILVSSSTHETSFTEQRIQAGMDDEHTVVRCPTLWDVKPRAYSGKKFYVFKGNNSLDPYIVTNIDDLNQYKITEGLDRSNIDESISDNSIIEQEIFKMPDLFKDSFLGVPVELKKGFESNLMQSLQDIGGVSVAPTGRLFTSKPVYFNNCVSYIKHPFISQSITISTGDSIGIQDFLKRGHEYRDLDKPRYIHIDQSLTTDCTGISSVYMDGFIEDDDGVKKPIIGVDFMIQIVPPKPPKKIAIYKVRDFIIYLNKVLKFNLGKVTYDIFNSEESRQILSELGYNVAYSSVDRTDKAYVDFITLLYEERVRMYDYEPARRELFSLIHNRVKRKVDHPKKNGDGTYGCFLGDTKIKLLNGTSVSIEDLVGKKDVELYGCLSDGTIVPTVARKIFKTKEVTKYVKITLDNGKEIKCTLEHRFMLRDGTYKEAQYLSSDDSLMPLYYDYDGKFLKGYERVIDNKTGRWRYTHSIVSDFYNGKLVKGYLVHHYDIDKLNNTRKNLKVMTREEHSRVHAMLSSLGCTGENLERRVNSYKRGVRERNGLPTDFPLAPYEYRNEISKKCYSDRDREEISENPYKLLDMMAVRLKTYREKVEENSNRVKGLSYREQIREDSGLPKDFPLAPCKFKDILGSGYLSQDEKDIIAKNPYLLLDEDFIDMLEVKKSLAKANLLVDRNRSAKQREISSRTVTNTNTLGWWASDVGKERRKELSKTQLVDARNQRIEREDRDWISLVDIEIPIVSVRQAMKLYGGGYTAVSRRLDVMEIDFRSNYLIVRDYDDSKLESIGLSRKIVNGLVKTFNHRIISKEIIECDSLPVYDIEVPLTSNFALEAGVFVHNSKDVMDSLVGAVHNALTSEFSDNQRFDGIGDFRYANPMFGKGGAISHVENVVVEDAIDRQLDSMLEDLGIDLY